MRRIFTMLFIGILPFFSLAQTKCATDYMDSIAIANDPSILERRAELESFTKNYLNRKNKSSDTLIIPIVFHVLHQYGNERISFDQIQKGVDLINKDFKALNNDLNNIISEFRDVIGSANIEVRLAQIDPDGNCTSGIVYYDTELTNMATNSLKYVIQNWDPSSYLNVWSVKSIASGAAAWAHYPGNEPTIDGVVSTYGYIGTGHTLSHEIGHYLNLIHPWGSSNEPGTDSNCNTDDEVEDTPNTIGSPSTCDLSQVTCGSLDNVQNIMDYSSCESMFTKLQVERMRAALNSSIAYRNNLWTNGNLSATGTQDGYVSFDCDPIADFSSLENMIIQGESVSFQAYQNGGTASTWNWVFEQGLPATANTINPIVSYQTSGLFKAKLTAKSDFGQSTLERKNIVRVIDTLQGIIAPAFIDMEDTDFPYYPDDVPKQWVFQHSGSGNWTHIKNGSNNSLRIINSDNYEDTKNSFITANINLSEINNPEEIYFDYAFAQKEDDNLDELKVFVSRNGGKNWSLRYSQRGKSLSTNGGTLGTDTFVPQATEWETGEINFAYNSYDNFVLLKFEMTSRGGNALYIDNIRIGNTYTSIFKQQRENNISIYPNPTKDEFNIKYTVSKTGSGKLSIYSILGTLVYNKQINFSQTKGEFTLNKFDHGLQNGIYFIELLSPESKITERLVITE